MWVAAKVPTPSGSPGGGGMWWRPTSRAWRSGGRPSTPRTRTSGLRPASSGATSISSPLHPMPSPSTSCRPSSCSCPRNRAFGCSRHWQRPSGRPARCWWSGTILRTWRLASVGLRCRIASSRQRTSPHCSTPRGRSSSARLGRGGSRPQRGRRDDRPRCRARGPAQVTGGAAAVEGYLGRQRPALDLSLTVSKYLR